MAEVFRCKEPFSYDVKGIPTVVRLGDLVTDDDPRFRGHEQFFERGEDAAASGRAVERATAEPGGARVLSTHRPRAPKQG